MGAPVAGAADELVPGVEGRPPLGVTGLLGLLGPFGSSSLERAISEFTAHYNSERPHQGLDNELISARGASDVSANGDVIVSERLGGLLKHYHRVAA